MRTSKCSQRVGAGGCFMKGVLYARAKKGVPLNFKSRAVRLHPALAALLPEGIFHSFL